MPADDLQVRLSRVTSPRGTCLTASVSVAGVVEASQVVGLSRITGVHFGGLERFVLKKREPAAEEGEYAEHVLT